MKIEVRIESITHYYVGADGESVKITASNKETVPEDARRFAVIEASDMLRKVYRVSNAVKGIDRFVGKSFEDLRIINVPVTAVPWIAPDGTKREITSRNVLVFPGEDAARLVSKQRIPDSETEFYEPLAHVEAVVTADASEDSAS